MSYTADKAVVQKWFRESMTARAEQRAASALISEQNVKMPTEDGVHPGVLSLMRRIGGMSEGKRGYHIYLTKLYLEWLEEELRDPTFQAPAGASVHPFADRKSAAA